MISSSKAENQLWMVFENVFLHSSGSFLDAPLKKDEKNFSRYLRVLERGSTARLHGFSIWLKISISVVQRPGYHEGLSRSRNSSNQCHFSKQAANVYSISRHYEECSSPCFRMDVDAKFKTKTNSSKSVVSFIFPSEVSIVEEFFTDSVISVGKFSFSWLDKLW